MKDLRKVEALESRSDFDLIFDKLYRWEAGSESERENFLNILVKLAHRYLGNEQLAKIEFKVYSVTKNQEFIMFRELTTLQRKTIGTRSSQRLTAMI